MNLIAYALFLIAGLSVMAWLRRRPHDGPFLNQFPTAWVCGVCCVGVMFYVPTWRADSAAARAGRVMSALTGQKVSYTCASAVNVFFDRSTDDALGYVRFDENGKLEKRAKLRYDLCRGLVDFVANPNDLINNRREKIFAVHALTHEARHMMGEHNEAIADCQAVQRNAQTARGLGANEATAGELAVVYYQTIYPHHPYASADCKQGGPLDENLPSSPWRLRGRQEKLGAN